MSSRRNLTTIFVTLCIVVFASVNSQPQVESLGLDGKLITSMGIYGYVIVVGTDGDGVFYQNSNWLPDSSWINVGLEGKNVTAVYPHKSGPVGWGIAAGLFPDEGDSNYVYCSFMGEDFYPNSFGISDSLANGVYHIAGFPDWTICGEKYTAAGGTLYRQLWGDTAWVPIYSDGLWPDDLIYVKTDENYGGLVMAGGSTGFTGVLLIKSTDYGDTWEHIYPPGGARAFDFDIDSTFSDFRTIFVAHGLEISRSLDGGVNWEIVLNAGGCNYLDEIVFDPTHGRVFAAGGDCLDTTSAVLFYSDDMGENWIQIQLDFGGPIVDLEFTSEGYLYMAAPWTGVYRIDLDELSINNPQTPSSITLHQIFPNPFNLSTTIRFFVGTADLHSLRVFDITGRLVETLVNNNLQAGEHEVVWNASGFSSGIYFVKLESVEFVENQKVILLK